MKEFDLFVIGAGSGGVRAARMSAGAGARVAIAEDRYMGGTCVNVGCVPKKLYVYASEYAHAFSDAKGFGWDVSVGGHDWSALVASKKAEISRLNGIYNTMLDNTGVELFNARAKIVGPNEVEVGGERVKAKRILVATGGWPYMPAIEGIEHAVSSNEIFDLEHFPKRILIVGGGYVAVEFAGVFNGLGSQVHLSYRGARVLKSFDEDMVLALQDEMRKNKIDLRLNEVPERIEKLEDGSLRVHMKGAEALEVDQVLMATGRQANTSGLGLESAGVETRKNGSIPVDDGYQTNVPSVFALGDVIGHNNQLTPVPTSEAMVIVARQNGGDAKREMD